jgi:hypothetical protein
MIHRRTRVPFVGRFARFVVLRRRDVGFRFFFFSLSADAADSAALSFPILISHVTGAKS